jgi:hypothetical protein
LNLNFNEKTVNDIVDKVCVCVCVFFYYLWYQRLLGSR